MVFLGSLGRQFEGRWWQQLEVRDTLCQSKRRTLFAQCGWSGNLLQVCKRGSEQLPGTLQRWSGPRLSAFS